MDYPREKTENCRFCGQPMKLVRRGDGKPFRGRVAYWYTEPDPHHCAEREAIRKGLAPASRAMARAFGTRPAGE